MSNVRKTLQDRELATYVAAQLNTFFPDGKNVTRDAIQLLFSEVMARLEHCFSAINNKYFFDGQNALFNHLQGDQYAMFLYLAANTAYRQGAGDGLPEKLFLLNKALHGIDAFYEVELPSIFLFVHPLGTILGRGSYSDYFLVYQRCGIGSNHDVYPQLGKYLTLRPGAAILGKCRIADDCTIAAESFILDKDLPGHSLYIGHPRDFIIRPNDTPLTIWRGKQ